VWLEALETKEVLHEKNVPDGLTLWLCEDRLRLQPILCRGPQNHSSSQRPPSGSPMRLGLVARDKQYYGLMPGFLSRRRSVSDAGKSSYMTNIVRDRACVAVLMCYDGGQFKAALRPRRRMKTFAAPWHEAKVEGKLSTVEKGH